MQNHILVVVRKRGIRGLGSSPGSGCLELSLADGGREEELTAFGKQGNRKNGVHGR